MNHAPILVAGFGNPLLGDEGIGVRIIEALADRTDLPPGVELLDAGTAGLLALHRMAGRARAILVDCAFMDLPPGTLRRFRPEEAAARGARPRLSLHEGDLLELIALSRRLGECPPDVLIFGIQPDRVGPGDQLSPALACRLPGYVAALRAELDPTPPVA